MELRPCPFCGSKPVRRVVMDALHVECPVCVSVGFHNHVRLGNRADIEWNTRSYIDHRGNANGTTPIERLEAEIKNTIDGGVARHGAAVIFAERLQQIINKAKAGEE